ncbi:MAG: mandelate racemase/muconate lactonizing enzyme family protein [Pseudomonadota bacterium]
MIEIADIRTHLLSVPFADPPQTGFLTLDLIHLLVVEVEARDGTIGTGHLHPLGPGIRTLDTCIHEMMAPLLIGADAGDPAALWDRMWGAHFIHGRMGITVMAASALDIALWDLVGRTQGKPLWQIWGGQNRDMPVYGSGCYRGLGHDGMIEKAQRFVDQGFSAIKMQAAHLFTEEEDVVNVRDMRGALGDRIEIMMDVNQGLSADAAISLGRRLDPYRLAWLEEPVIADDWAGYHRVADAIETPVVGGENHFLSYDLARFFESGKVPILQPDIMRGGYTGLRRVAEDANRSGLTIAPHRFPELSSHLTASIPNPDWLEWMGWYDHLWVDPLPISAGHMRAPDRPGHGMDFRAELFTDCVYRDPR